MENAGDPARTHYVWMQWIAANMGDLFDAWAQHVYWFYNDAGRLEYRLRDIWHLQNEVLPPEQRKPTYMMEYGIRGIATCGGEAVDREHVLRGRSGLPGDLAHEHRRVPAALVRHRLGPARVHGRGEVGRVLGRVRPHLAPPQVYWTVGPATEGSPLTPSYHALALLFHTTVPGWQVVRVAPWDESDWGVPTYGIEGHSSNDTPEKELAAYAGPSGELTILGLDTNGRALNAAVDRAAVGVQHRRSAGEHGVQAWCSGTRPATGTNTVAGTVTTDAAGVARFEVPLQAAFSLTTVPFLSTTRGRVMRAPGVSSCGRRRSPSRARALLDVLSRMKSGGGYR